jgi:hypothetical protein
LAAWALAAILKIDGAAKSLTDAWLGWGFVLLEEARNTNSSQERDAHALQKLLAIYFLVQYFVNRFAYVQTATLK